MASCNPDSTDDRAVTHLASIGVEIRGHTGMSAVFQPEGGVQGVLPAFTRGVLNAEVRGYRGMTPYARLGNRPVAVLSLLVVAALIASRRR